MSIQPHTNTIIPNPGSKDFLADYYFKENNEPLPLVIFCHGYKGFKDWGGWYRVAEQFAEAGFFFVKFNFSHNGTTVQNPLEFDDLEAFGNNNFSKEANDIDQILEYFSSFKEVDADRIAIIGHSRGGGISLIKAYEDEKIKALITWNGVSNFKYRFPNDLKKWKEAGVFYSENKRTHQQMPHYFQFYEDFSANEERFNIQYAAQHFTKPFLILHGGDDETVKTKEPELLHEWAKNSELVYIGGGTHTFNTKHPWPGKEVPPQMQQAIDLSVNFLKRNLK